LRLRGGTFLRIDKNPDFAVVDERKNAELNRTFAVAESVDQTNGSDFAH
jgi:hypothetical protein